MGMKNTVKVINNDWREKKLVIKNKTIISRYKRPIPTFLSMVRALNK